jgi:hypothetical protein
LEKKLQAATQNSKPISKRVWCKKSSQFVSPRSLTYKTQALFLFFFDQFAGYQLEFRILIIME